MYTDFRLVLSGYRVCDLLHSFSLYQVDGATSKTAPGHPGAVNSRLLRSDIHHQIQLRAAHFVIVTQTDVRLAHQLTKVLQIACFECFGSISDALNLCDYMTAPAI